MAPHSLHLHTTSPQLRPQHSSILRDIARHRCSLLGFLSSPRLLKCWTHRSRSETKSRPPRKTRWICQVNTTENTATDSLPSGGNAHQEKSLLSESTGDSSSSSLNIMEGPTKTTNRIIALASAATAVGLFSITHGGISGVSLSDLAASSLSYEEALANGRPTVLEFYANWCEVCREMAPDVYKVEQEYMDRVNFVMLNVDNGKWEEELDEFGVEGIPHFAFLDKLGNEEGNIVGRLPKKYLLENVVALARGDEAVPHTRIVGQFSSADLRQAPTVVEPRSHSNF